MAASTSHHVTQVAADETYERGGGAQRAHGDEYHLLVLMTILLRAYIQALDFEVAIEYDPAGKFDDIYLRSKTGEQWRDTYFQIKHTVKESAEIKVSDLLPAPQKGNKKVSCKYNILDFLDSFVAIMNTNIARARTCFLFTNQKWQYEQEMSTLFQFMEVKTHDIDAFLINIMKPTVIQLGTAWHSRIIKAISTDAKDAFTNNFFIAQDQKTLLEIKTELQALMFELANNNSTLGHLMFDNLYGQLQKWFNTSIGTFKGKSFVHNFIKSFVNNAKFFYRHRVRDPNKHFVGRVTQLQAITETTKKEPGEFVDVAVVGPSGYGKTQLVLKYLHDHDSKFTHVCWINADNEATIEHAFVYIAKKLNIDNTACSEEELVHEVYTSFNDKQQAVFVFDNAGDIDDIMKYLPSKSLVHIKIFVTSNYIDWPAQVSIKLGVFEEEESLQLARKILGDLNCDEAAVNNLASTLGHFPLALHLACSFIMRMASADDSSQPNQSITQFLKLYSEEPVNFHNLNPSFKDYNAYKHPLYKIWSLQKDKLARSGDNGKLAIRIMNIISLCDSDNIPYSLIEQLDDTKENISNSLNLLQTFSLIDVKDDKVFVHNLLQDVIRQDLSHSGQLLEFLKVLLHYCDNIKTSAENGGSYLDFDLISHAMKFWQHLSDSNESDLITKFSTFPQLVIHSLSLNFIYRQAIQFADSALTTLGKYLQPTNDDVIKTRFFLARAKNIGGMFREAIAELREIKELIGGDNLTHDKKTLSFMINSEIAFCLTRLGKHEEALTLYDQILADRREMMGVDHQDSLMTQHNRTIVLQDMGKYDEALSQYDLLLEIEQEKLGAEHSGTLTTLNSRALVLKLLGKHEEALKIYQSLLKVESKKYGADHPSTLCTMNNLALVLHTLGKYEEALDVNNQVLAVKNVILGEEHPDTLTTLHNKASVLDDMGNYSEALTVFNEIIERRTESLGADHQNTLNTMNNKALVLQHLGRFDEALCVYDFVLNAQKKSLGCQHPNTVTSMCNRALLLSYMGKYEEALGIFDQIIVIDEQKLGSEHPDTLTVLNNKATVLRDMGRFDECLELYTDVLHRRQASLGQDHPSTLITMANKALTLQQMGKYAEALVDHTAILEMQTQILGKHHPTTLATLNSKAMLLRHMGKYEEALQLFDDILVVRTNLLGVDHPSTLVSMNNKALVLQNMKQFSAALSIYDEVLTLQNEKLGSKHPNNLATMHNRASVLQQLGRYSEALAEIDKLIETEKEILGEEHPSTLTSIYGKALVLQNMNRLDEAITLYDYVLALQQIKLGPQHPKTLSTMHNKATVLCQQGLYTEAQALLLQVYEMKVQVLGSHHPSTLITLKYLQP